MRNKITISFETDWDKRKIPMMARDMRVALHRMGGIHNYHWTIEGQVDNKPKKIHLGCSRCEKGNGKDPQGWHAWKFEACPKCGLRDGVYKMGGPKPVVESPPQPEPVKQEPIQQQAQPSPKSLRPQKEKQVEDHKHVWGRNNQCLHRDCTRKKPGRTPKANG